MPFKKGQSGNPGGRPKMPDDLKKAMQGMAAEALEVLKDSLRSEDERMRLEAVKILLDRGYGKPAQQVDLSTKTDLGAVHLEALKQLNAGKTAAVAAAASVDEDEAPTTH